MEYSQYSKKCEVTLGSLQIELYVGEPYVKEGMIFCVPLLRRLQYNGKRKEPIKHMSVAN